MRDGLIRDHGVDCAVPLSLSPPRDQTRDGNAVTHEQRDSIVNGAADIRYVVPMGAD